MPNIFTLCALAGLWQVGLEKQEQSHVQWDLGYVDITAVWVVGSTGG